MHNNDANASLMPFPVLRRAQAILALLRDPERLDRERRDFAARRPALSGFSRDAAPIGLGLSSAATFVSQVCRDGWCNMRCRSLLTCSDTVEGQSSCCILME